MPDRGIVGKSIEQYRIERLLGQGGMAAVYEATDMRLQRSVAVKIMHPHLASQNSFRERFLQEAQAAARLDHPNIVKVYYFGGNADELYLVMELISGGNLRKFVKKLHEEGLFINYPEAIEIVRQLALALDYAHKQGMIHRDMKPDNVVLKPEVDPSTRLNYRPIITDFGLAKLTETSDEDAATDEQPIGTYPYMSPEQVNADDVDARTDIYALGVILYELSVGRLPFNPKTIAEAAKMHGREDVPLPTKLRRGFPEDLEDVILTCLAKDPDERYASAELLAQELTGLQKPVKRLDTPPTASSVLEDWHKTDLMTPMLRSPLPLLPPHDPPPLSEAERASDCLVFYSADGSFVVPVEKDTLTIGRGTDQDIVLEGQHTSRAHARLERKPNGKFYLIDHGTINGTYVDDQRLIKNTPVILRADSVVRLGNYWMQILPRSEQVLEAVIAEDDAEHEAAFKIGDVTDEKITQLMGIPPIQSLPQAELPSLTSHQMSYDRLIVFHGDQKPYVVTLEHDNIIIGRQDTCDVVLDSPTVSRHHARLFLKTDGQFYITDLESTNGVWFDNERLPVNFSARVNPTKVIRIGDFWLRFEFKQDVKSTNELVARPAESTGTAEVRKFGATLTVGEEDDDSIETVRMVKPIDEDMPPYSPPPMSNDMRASDRLVLFSEDHPMQMVKIDKEIMTIGRGANQDIRLKGRRVSREHAILEVRSDGTLHITDLESRNGVWIGDTLLVPHTQVQWSPHEIVRIANYWMKFERASGSLDPFAALGQMDSRGLVGKTIANYRIDRYIGENPLSAVYKATEVPLEREVALKIMHPNLAAESSLRQRFLEEARLLSRLDHPNIVRVLSYNSIENEVFMVMELVTGGNLRRVINELADKGRQMEYIEAVDLVIQMANGLHYAHQQGLLHRDIRPENVTLKSTAVIGPIMQYQPVLTDFAIARYVESGDIYDADRPEIAFPYMSPEQCLGRRTDIRSDIYELGIVLYELIIGTPPYEPRSIAEAVRMHAREPLVKPSDKRSGITEDLEKVILKSLAKDPNDRYQTAIEMARALERAMQTVGTEDAESAGESISPDDIYATKVLQTPLPKEMPLRTAPPRPQGRLELDRLVFYSETHPTKVITLSKDVLTIGRGDDQDVVLDSDKISRRHARVERGYDHIYRIVDVGSKNGSWLGNYRLINNVAEIWEPSETVRVGDYWVRIEEAGSDPDVDAAPVRRVGADGEEYSTDISGNGAEARPARRKHAPPDHDKITVNVNTHTVSVVPGSTGTMSVEVVNQSDFVDHFTVEAAGLPADWITQPPQPLYLLPYNRETTSITFHPPPESTSSAGAHAFEVRVTSRAKRINAVRTQGSLVISPFHAYTTGLYPERIKGRGQVELTIRNTGNTFETFNILARDREQAVRFRMEGQQYTLPPGHTEQIMLRVLPVRRPWFGAAQFHPFEVITTPNPPELAGGPQTQRGELVVRARLAVWMLFVVVLLLLACGIVAFLIFNDARSQRNANATATAYAQATHIIATETAVVLADPDGDGLTNVREAELGTFPDLADTDEDGLDDGQEVRVWLTNPLNRDTDGDGLSDGEEVELGTDPLNRDTDNDGIPDNEDPFPTFRSTPTPTPYPTIPGTFGDICPGSPTPSRLAVGMRANVEPGGVANRLRAEPGLAGEIIEFMDPETEFIIIGGPVCDETDQIRWWEVDFDGTTGWTAEGEGEEYYLCPPDDCGSQDEDAEEPEADPEAVQNQLPASNTVALDRTRMGIQLYTNISSNDWTRLISFTDPLAVGWVKLQANWRYLQPQSADQRSPQFEEFISYIHSAKGRGYRVLVSIVKAPDWARSSRGSDGPPDDPDDLAQFVQMILDSAGQDIDAIEVWNEPNLRREWTGRLPFSGSGYMRLFEPAYETIRDYSSSIWVVTAGLAPAIDSNTSKNDRNFLGQMYRAGLADYERIGIGIHPYGWGNAPDAVCCDPVEGRGWDEAPQFFFLNTISTYRAIMRRHDHDSGRLWATEFGWTTWADYNAEPPEAWMNYVSPQDQARYTIRAFEIGQSLNYMGPMFLWNFNYANTTTVSARNEIAGYSLVFTDDNRALHARPIYHSLSTRQQ